MFTGKCRHDSERLEELASALNPASPTTEVKQPTSASDRSAQTGSISGAGPRAKNASQSDLFAQLLRSSGAPPLDVSELFGVPAAVPFGRQSITNSDSVKGSFTGKFASCDSYSLYICLQELRIISFSVVNMTEKSQSCYSC